MEEIKEDFLEVDSAIRGQNYTCLSFVSPETTLNNKSVFLINSFLKTIAKKYDLDENTIQDTYKDFLYINEDKLEKEFYEKNEFQTTVRGLKVRGVYDTLKEAQHRSKKLQKLDPNFNVFIGQVGYWLPWDPNPHKIENQEYGESELNNLVKKYRENKDMKDIHFQENIEYAKSEADKQKKAKENSLEKEGPERVNTEDVINIMEEEDTWLKRKLEQTSSD
tara:strand:- start:5047 stop:5709 length:663 start_codon:yes stop_codon:yes gene_type:complete